MTPKGTQPANQKANVETVQQVDTTPSPAWVSYVLFGLLGIGMLVIFVNYAQVFGDTNNGITLLGLAFILGGIITATRLR